MVQIQVLIPDARIFCGVVWYLLLFRKLLSCFPQFCFRNAIENSGTENNTHTRLMRLNGEEVIWRHIIDVFKQERRVGWSYTGLTSESVYLDNFSKMRVNLMEKVC
jgi:hypothetical protein